MLQKSISAFMKDWRHLSKTQRTGDNFAKIETRTSNNQQNHSKTQSITQGTEKKINWESTKGTSTINLIPTGKNQRTRAR